MSDPYTRPLPASAALVLIDVQRDTYADGAPLPVEGTREAIPAMAHLATAFREHGLPIVHVVRLYRPDGSNVDLIRRHAIQEGARLLLPGSPGSQIAPELLPKAVELDHELLLGGDFQQVGGREYVMYKPRWGAFYQTKLEQFLRDSKSDTVVFAGCNFPNCHGPLSTRRPNATFELCWCSTRCRGFMTEVSRNAVKSASRFEICRPHWHG